MTIRKPKIPNKPYIKSYELFHKLDTLNIDQIQASITKIQDQSLKERLTPLISKLKDLLTIHDAVKKVEQTLSGLREDKDAQLIEVQTYLEQTQLTDLFKKSLTQNLTEWVFNPLENVKQLYRAMYNHLTEPKKYRILEPTLNEWYKRFQITTKEGVLQLLIDEKIIRVEIKYSCPRCDEDLSIEGGDEYFCMNCTFSVLKESVESECSSEKEIYRGDNFEKIKDLIG